LKLGIVIGITNWKKSLPFGGDPVADTDSASLFNFPHHYKLGYRRIFISISHTVIGRFFTKLGEMTDTESITFWEQSSGHCVPDQSGNPNSNSGSRLVSVRRVGGGMLSLRAV